MLADFYITRLSNAINMATKKNDLEGQFFYRSFVPPKKRRHNLDVLSLLIRNVTVMSSAFMVRDAPHFHNYIFA